MPGQIVHYEIPTDDTANAREFWGSLFGWQFESFPGPMEYHMARIGEQSGAAIMPRESGTQGPRAYFDVEDIKSGAARVKELGGDSSDPMPVPQMGWFVTCTDPSGNHFGLWQSDPNAQAPGS